VKLCLEKVFYSRQERTFKNCGQLDDAYSAKHDFPFMVIAIGKKIYIALELAPKEPAN
jgi:hypothetical protein